MTAERTYRPPAFDFSSDGYKARFSQRAKEMNMPEDELRERINGAWLNTKDRDELLDEIERLQELRTKIEYEYIKKTQLMWDV